MQQHLLCIYEIMKAAGGGTLLVLRSSSSSVCLSLSCLSSVSTAEKVLTHTHHVSVLSYSQQRFIRLLSSDKFSDAFTRACLKVRKPGGGVKKRTTDLQQGYDALADARLLWEQNARHVCGISV